MSVENLLANPVYNALLTGDKHLGFGTDKVKYFAEEVSPFAGFEHDDADGFNALHQLLPAQRKILYAIPAPINIPAGWELYVHIKGLQFVYEGSRIINDFPGIIPLNETHVEQMTELAQLTRPGPFAKKTIDFGYYHGIFGNDKLVAMTGQRLHVGNYTEISAVCTHPDHTGKGYAFALMQHQLQLIQQQGQLAFLHVREDNQRAIALYERMGFVVSRPMNFYFMRRK